MKNRILLFGLVFCLFAFKSADEKVTIWLVGDSTIAEKLTTKYPETGWGMAFQNYFDLSKVTIENRAKNGRSTRTFLAEGLWLPIQQNLKAGDYVFIQFGHNDEGKGERYKDRSTTPEEFKINLIKYLEETKAKKAIPILITPVSRRYFDKEGNIRQTHEPYSNEVRELAKSEQVILIDLDEMSRKLYQQYGAENSKLLFLDFGPNLHPNYPAGVTDGTHFNEYGARLIAELVLNDLKTQKLPLAKYIVNSK
jgi:lysophospholipase L1-like esterase